MSVLLSLDRVHKSYWRGPREVVVLEDVSLDVHRGEFVAVWGQRGAGKTTLALVGAGLEAPEQGRVWFDGCDLATVSRPGSHLNAGIGWVQRGGPQSGDFRRVLDYVSLPLLASSSLRQARRRASAALSQVGAGSCAYELLANLTDGERTLVALAHALVREPKVLIADDPTASLDVLQRETVTRLLRQIADEDGLGVLITVPDMPDGAYADRIGALSDGQLVLPQQRPGDGGALIDFPGNRQSA